MAATAVAAAAPTSSASTVVTPSGNAGNFMKRVVSQVVSNDYNAAWRTLHPAHKRVAPRREYVTCELRNPVVQTLEHVNVLAVANRRLRVPGQRRAVLVKAIRLRITLFDAETGTDFQTTHVFHAVAVDRHWTWILPASAYKVYRTDSC